MIRFINSSILHCWQEDFLQLSALVQLLKTTLWVFLFPVFLLQQLSRVLWYTERSLSNITLGSVMVMVLVRTIQVNIAQIRVREWGGEGVRGHGEVVREKHIYGKQVHCYMYQCDIVYDWMLRSSSTVKCKTLLFCGCVYRTSTCTQTVWQRWQICQLIFAPSILTLLRS